MFNPASAFDPDFIRQDPAIIKALISPCFVIDETRYLQQLIPLAQLADKQLAIITQFTTQLIKGVRKNENAIHYLDALLLEYSLNSREGVLLMCLAEALLRIPDNDNIDALIRDKLERANWQQHRHSESLFVNASTWGLILGEKIINPQHTMSHEAPALHQRLITRLGEPVMRQAVKQAMKMLGKQFVQGQNIEQALHNSQQLRSEGYCFSFDMLGEAALTAKNAEIHFANYTHAIETVANTHGNDDTVSIKLSALHPRYEPQQKQRLLTELLPRLLELARLARRCDVGLTIDAEEADRLELSLALFEQVYRHPSTRGWKQLGLAVQAYSKRALPTLCWLAALARDQGDRIPVRLVKGAYWDSEIKWAQQLGLADYPVFTRKESTDLSYLVCAQLLLSEPLHGLIYPQFASHNAHTIASIITQAGHNDYEFQRLHGMGGTLYDAVSSSCTSRIRIYAPVGSHKELLPYLVRRLLENGANNAFVHRLIDLNTPIDELVQHPSKQLCGMDSLRNPDIPPPPLLFGTQRCNSSGLAIGAASHWLPLNAQLHLIESRQKEGQQWIGAPMIDGQQQTETQPQTIYSPFNVNRAIGKLYMSTEVMVEHALANATAAFAHWNGQPIEQRCSHLERAAELLEQHQPELIALCQWEAGKTIQDSIDEIREAVDFCRYYAQQARQLITTIPLPGPTGESNELYLGGRGVFACISPWNFPLAIFTGQIMAALATGNTVIAKPAEQTSLVATRAVELFHQAGIPPTVLQLLTGNGNTIGARLCADQRIKGVAFTGSNTTAQSINRLLANRDGAIATLIAETGGQNAMIVDSTALPEQAVADVIRSAFGSAGQRCSSLRVLYLQEDIAEPFLQLLQGAMAELQLGDPRKPDTDIGPVIDEAAQKALLEHIKNMRRDGKLVACSALSAESGEGNFVAPCIFEISHMNQLSKEHFGPILHVIRYSNSELDNVVQQINNCGYGLSLSIHTRNENRARNIESQVRVGNVYINRNQTGAVVGVQPFGGMGLSGTGPKAGGPHYLLRFATERTRTINTAAMGGNISLLSPNTH